MFLQFALLLMTILLAVCPQISRAVRPSLLTVPRAEGALTPAIATSGSQPQRPSLSRILNDRVLLGRDFPTVLAFVESWNRINEQKLYVFPDRVVGRTPYRTREEAQTASARLSEAMRAARSRPKAEFVDLLRGVSPQAVDQLRVEVIRFLPDDDYFHVALIAPSLRFLPQNLSVATVRERLGPPEKTELELIQNETERRPVVLTVHSYAGGAITFAESDWASPGYVDRITLDARAITAALF